jgi:hypothetical protein
MPERQQERRKMARLALEVLVKVQIAGSDDQFFAETRNVSAQGIYVCTHSTDLKIGQELDCVLVLPEKLTQATRPSLVNCHGRIVRIQRDLPENCIGVAMEISSFDFSVQNFASNFMHHA